MSSNPQVGLLIVCATFLLSPVGVRAAFADSPVVPAGWIKPEQLADAQRPLQAQLVTGKEMLQTAWSMATVKDAELLVVLLVVISICPTKKIRQIELKLSPAR